MQGIVHWGQFGGQGDCGQGVRQGFRGAVTITQPLLQAETLYDKQVTVQSCYDSTGNQMGAP